MRWQVGKDYFALRFCQLRRMAIDLLLGISGSFMSDSSRFIRGSFVPTSEEDGRTDFPFPLAAFAPARVFVFKRFAGGRPRRGFLPSGDGAVTPVFGIRFLKATIPPPQGTDLLMTSSS